MAKKGPIINGFTVPGGRGGAAVAKACQLIIDNPGIKQGDLHSQAAHWAGLNWSTANWITSPGPKSPAELLWSRTKDGRGFRCYPNEFTDKLGDPRPLLQAEILKSFDTLWKGHGSLAAGTLVRILRYNGSQDLGMLLGFTLVRGINYPDGLVSSREDLNDPVHFTLGNCGIMPFVQMPNGPQNWPFHMLARE